jgi:hypothetical protein
VIGASLSKGLRGLRAHKHDIANISLWAPVSAAAHPVVGTGGAITDDIINSDAIIDASVFVTEVGIIDTSAVIPILIIASTGQKKPRIRPQPSTGHKDRLRHETYPTCATPATK